jgi:hypothetical protein
VKCRADSNVALKDLDFIQVCKGLNLSAAQREQFVSALTTDCEVILFMRTNTKIDHHLQFLEKHNITDYSLLLGIHYSNVDTEQNGRSLTQSAENSDTFK